MRDLRRPARGGHDARHDVDQRLGKFIVRFGLGWLLAIALQMGIDGVYRGTVGENLFAALAVAAVGRSKLR